MKSRESSMLPKMSSVKTAVTRGEYRRFNWRRSLALPSSLSMGYLNQPFGAAVAFTTGATLAALAALLLFTLLRPSSSEMRTGV